MQLALQCPPFLGSEHDEGLGDTAEGAGGQVTLVSSPLYKLREHLAKGQRVLAGEGMSQVVRSLLELMARKTYYSGDLLFSVEILRNVTDTFKRATYIPSSEDVQVAGLGVVRDSPGRWLVPSPGPAEPRPRSASSRW